MSQYEDLVVDAEENCSIGTVRAFADRLESYQGALGVARTLRKLVDLIIRLKRREQDLLEANNRYLNLARDAELAYRESQRANTLLALRLRETLLEIERRAA